MILILDGVVGREDNSQFDPFNCKAKEYVGECCMPGALPLPLGITQCSPGFYCPWINDTTSMTNLILACPPTPVCQLQRLASGFCPAPQGKHEPILCPAGQLCRTPATMELCPDGFFCPPGSHTPKPCGPMSSCPAGTSRRLYLGAILICVIADAVLIISVLIYRFLRRRSNALHLRQMKHTGIEASMISTSQHHTLPRPTRKLVRFFNKAKGELREMDFLFSDLSMKLPTGQMILTGVTGQVKPGKVTAIMGPSGAGKTTFLYTLTGKMDASCVRGGDLTINGQHAQMSAFKKVVGYVPQDDVMMRELTVWDNIIHSGRIRLPHWSDEQIEGHARAVIEAMGLVDVASIKIGDETSRGVSGGQRKRVNIGMELAAAPLALFLDEPTSGLDATAAMDVCNLLRDIAQETGITVAMVIHQPRVEIWNHLDDILMLAPGGKTVYLGPQSKAQRYFESHLAVEVHAHENPADVLMDAIAQSGEAFATAWVATGKEFVANMPAMSIVTSGKAYGYDDEKKSLFGHHSATPSGVRPVPPTATAAARYDAAVTSGGLTTQAWANKGFEESDVLDSPPTNGHTHPFAVPSATSPLPAGAGSAIQAVNATSSATLAAATNANGSRPATAGSRATATTTVNGVASHPVSEIGANGALSSRLAGAHTSITMGAAASPGFASSTGIEGRVSPRTITAAAPSTDLTGLPPPQRISRSGSAGNGGTPILGTAHAPPNGAVSPRTLDTTTNDHQKVNVPSPTARQGFNGTVATSPTKATNPATTATTGTLVAEKEKPHVRGRHGRKDSQVVIASREPRGAPFYRQFYLCHIRSLKQQHEKLSALVLESGVAMFAGFLMGVGGGVPHQGILVAPYSLLSPAPLEFLIPQMCMFINMAIGLAASSAGVKAFGEERIVYWREAGAGHSPTAYFLGVATASFYRILLSAIHFSMVYHLLSAPLIGFGDLLLLTTLVFYTVYGLSAIVSMVVKRENAPLLAVVISLFAAVFGGYVETLPEPVKKFSYAYWSSEAMYDRSVTPFRGIYEVDTVSAPYWGYTLDHYSQDILILFIIGTAYRLAAFLLMTRLNRDKQR